MPCVVAKTTKAERASKKTNQGAKMSVISNQKSADHLMHLITTRNESVPNFSLLLGSGASSASGVRTAQNMISEWRRLIYKRSRLQGNYEEWLSEQDWYKHEDEYSLLFESIYDQPSQRRVYIEECVKSAHPSWGYVYLTNLLSKRYFDVVFTTNFDDLMNEACYLYSDGLRPIVAAHDSAIQGVRITSGRPKIIKLHGDFLYDNIKNTLSELETLESNTKSKFKQFVQEYGLIVIGYSGRDKSVMDTLDLLLRDQDNFKQGVYWCRRNGEQNSGRLDSLLRKDRVYLVEIDGFDEFMAELNEEAELALPKPIERPFDMARDRARLFVEVSDDLKSHPIIGSHVNAVLESITPTHRPHLPPAVEALMLSSSGELDKAIPKWEQAISEDPNDKAIAYHYAEALANAERYEKLTDFIHTSPLPAENQIYFRLRAGENEKVIQMATRILSRPTVPKEEDSVNLEFVRINRAIAFKRLGHTSDMENDLNALERNGGPTHINIKAGIAALRKEKEHMLSILKESLHDTITPDNLMAFPVFEDYREDSEFLKLLK